MSKKHPRLKWITTLSESLQRATGGQLQHRPQILDTVDPLCKRVEIKLHEKFHTGIERYMIAYLFKEFGKVNNCSVLGVLFKDDMMIVHVAIDRRLGPEMNTNPML